MTVSKRIPVKTKSVIEVTPALSPSAPILPIKSWYENPLWAIFMTFLVTFGVAQYQVIKAEQQIRRVERTEQLQVLRAIGVELEYNINTCNNFMNNPEVKAVLLPNGRIWFGTTYRMNNDAFISGVQRGEAFWGEGSNSVTAMNAFYNSRYLEKRLDLIAEMVVRGEMVENFNLVVSSTKDSVPTYLKTAREYEKALGARISILEKELK
jgi:hypothetical protein